MRRLSFFLFISLVSLPSLSPNKQAPSEPFQANTRMDPSEAQSLFSVMEAMSSDHRWRLSHPNPCTPGSSWPGLECKQGKDSIFHVTRLDFGSPPNPTCKATAKFPSQIFHLPHLQSVFFFHCFTHTKTTFSVSPLSLSANSSLQQLSLRKNPALVGPIPPQLSYLKSLEVLTLSQNRLTGSIPVGIFRLTSLMHLDLSYNSLTGPISDLMGNLRNLEGLDLSYNSLSGSIPSTIGDLGLLQKLDLSSNWLVGSIPDTFQKLNSLVFLALSNNRLQGYFPKGLAKLQNLQYFIMDDNPLSISLPLELGKLAKLQELRLSNSGFKGSIPHSFSQLLNLSTLSLQNNGLSGEIPTGFRGLPHIYHLNLSRNMLSGVVPFDSSFLNRLGKNLDLSGNPGLCLSPSEAYGVKIGVGVCGRNGTASSVAGSVQNSGASSALFKSFSLLAVLICFLWLFLGCCV